MKSARLLIVSGAALSRNPRVLKEAETLAAAGHDVTVLTLRNHAGAEVFDRQIMATARFRRIVLDVAPAPGASPAGVFLRRLRTSGTRWAARQFGRESIETIGPAGELLSIARRQSADLVIGHTEVGLWVAGRLHDEGRKVAADLEDWHSEDLPASERLGRPVRLLHYLEKKLLREAVYTSTVCDALADALHHTMGGNRAIVIGNTFPLQPNPRQGPPGDPPVFFWCSQTLGPSRGLEGFLEAWSRMTAPSRVVLVGEDRRGYREVLRGLVPGSRRAWLEFADLVPPPDLPTLIAQHDIGLALETPASRNRELAVTNKLLQYLNAGLAVVATPTIGQREVLDRAPDAGVFLDQDPATGAATLDRLVGDKDALRTRQLAARRLAESRYHWGRDARVLLDAVNRALSA